jgi:hypothetical protein
MAFYESELVEAMFASIVDGAGFSDAQNDIKTFHDAVNLLPKYNTPELMVFLMRKVVKEAVNFGNLEGIMREAFADLNGIELEISKK